MERSTGGLNIGWAEQTTRKKQAWAITEAKPGQVNCSCFAIGAAPHTATSRQRNNCLHFRVECHTWALHERHSYFHGHIIDRKSTQMGQDP